MHRFYDFLLILKTIITKKVDIRLSSKALNNFCEKHDNWFLVLDSSLNEKEIRLLFRKHFNNFKKIGSNLVLSEIAEHPNAPLDILHDLSNSQDERIFMALSTNSNISSEIIEKLIMINNYAIDEHLLMNKALSGKEKHYLSQRQEKNNQPKQ